MIPFIPFLLLVSILPFHAMSFSSNCTGSTYAVNSTYQTNLNTLLSSLAADSSSSLYSNATSGTSANRIYGLYLCEGDLSPAECQTFVQTAVADITANKSCPSSRQAVIWYDNGMFRYSDANFFGVPDTNGFNIANGDRSLKSPVPYQMVTNLIKIAPLRRPMFASNASMSTGSYAMAQCTDDLTPAGCSQCLNTIFNSIKACCLTSVGWQYLSASCKIRYEGYLFFMSPDDTYAQIVESTCSAIPATNRPDALLSFITSKAAPTGFYNDTQGEIFGLALCRADIVGPSDDCNNCLTQASSALTTDYCPNYTQGTVWYEKCMVRYSNESFFGVVDYGGKSYCGVEQISNEAGSDNVVFVTALVGVAVKNTLLFAANATGIGSALVQCGRDLSSEGCDKCLQKGINVVSRDCKQTNGWRYLSGSCTIRYEEYVFFNVSAIGIGAPAPQFAPYQVQLSYPED